MRIKSCNHKGFYHYEQYCDGSIHRYRVCYDISHIVTKAIE